MTQKISILTATYNALPGLRDTMASLASQTFRDFEHVVVDGRSTDGTQDWLADLDQPVRWMREPDR